MSNRERKLKYGLNSGLAILIVAGILIAANVIGNYAFARLDLTEGREFTISKSTKSILNRLDDIVQVKVFFSKKLPPQLTTLEQNVADLLKEYSVYSKGKVTVRFVRCETEEEKGQARAMGIPELQMNVLEKDQYQVSNVYLGMGLQYGDKTQAIPTVQDLSSLEYELSSAIVKLTATEEPAIGFLTGNQERGLDKDLQSLKTALDAQYQVRPVDLSEGRTAVPEDIKTLIVAGAKNVGDREQYEIDQFLMRGGRGIFLLDAINMNEMTGLQAFPASSGLDDLLDFYGVKMKQALALDPRSEMASFSQGYMAYTIAYPMWPKITSQQAGFDTENPITSRLEAVVLPWTAPLEVNVALRPDAKGKASAAAAPPSNTQQPDVQATVLCKSTDRAWTQTGRYDLNPQAIMSSHPNPTGQQMPLAVMLTGKFRSYYNSNPIPAKPTEAAPVDEFGATAPAETGPADTPIATSPDTQILVVGTSQLVVDQFLRMFPANTLFVENAVDYMSRGDELIAIRSRGATERPLKQLGPGAKAAIKWANTLGVPALVIAFGLIRRAIMKKQRDSLPQQFARSDGSPALGGAALSQSTGGAL